MNNYDRRYREEFSSTVEETKTEPKSSSSKLALVVTDRLNLRHSASVDATIDAVLTKGTSLRILGYSGKDWVKVTVPDSNKTGYVMKKFIEEM